MQNLNITALFPDVDTYPKIISYRSPVCVKAESVFRNNMGIVETLGMVPGYAFMNGEEWNKATQEAMRLAECDDPKNPRVVKLTNDIWAAHDFRGFDEAKRAQFKEATEHAERMACMPGRTLSSKALLSLLKSILIQSWSAYELLADHLIKGCKEKHPTLFSNEIRTKRHSVRSERTIGPSFDAVFGSDAAINDAAWNAGLKGHALLRHLLIHSNAKVDGQHITQRQEAPIVTEWDAYNLDDEIPIEGGMVLRLVDRTTHSVYALLKAVSDWIDAKT